MHISKHRPSTMLHPSASPPSPALTFPSGHPSSQYPPCHHHHYTTTSHCFHAHPCPPACVHFLSLVFGGQSPNRNRGCIVGTTWQGPSAAVEWAAAAAVQQTSTETGGYLIPAPALLPAASRLPIPAGACSPSCAMPPRKSGGSGARTVSATPVRGCCRVNEAACSACRSIQGPAFCIAGRQSDGEKTAALQ